MTDKVAVDVKFYSLCPYGKVTPAIWRYEVKNVKLTIFKTIQ